jgi:hypothetical protein
MSTDALSRVTPAERAQGSGLIMTIRQLGGTIGVAAADAAGYGLALAFASALVSAAAAVPGGDPDRREGPRRPTPPIESATRPRVNPYDSAFVSTTRPSICGAEAAALARLTAPLISAIDSCA